MEPIFKLPISILKEKDNSYIIHHYNYYNGNKTYSTYEYEINISHIKASGEHYLYVSINDNISGGATLSDVCYQCKQLGIENIIPITFGRMYQSNTMRGIVLNTPKNGYNFS